MEWFAWAMGLGLAWMVQTGAVVGDPVASKAAEARKHYGRGEYEEALKLYRDAQLQDPWTAALHFNVGDALFKLGDSAAALEEFKKAAIEGEDGPLRGQAFYNMGKTYFQQGQFGEAAEAFKQVLGLDWQDRLAKVHLELALEHLKDQQEGEQDQQQGEQDQQEDQQQGQQGEQDQQQGEQDQQEDQQQGQQGEQDQQQGEQDQQEGQQQGQQGEQDQQEGEQDQREGQQDQPHQGKPGPGTGDGQDEGSEAVLPLKQEEAERLLEALEDREKQALLRRFQSAPRARGKDW